MLPYLGVANVFFRTGGEGDFVVGESEGLHQFEGQLQHAADLVFHLLGPTKDVGVVLGEATHPHQAVQYAAAFVAVDCTQLGEPQGQFPVAAQGRAVDGDMEGTVHRLEEVFLLIHLYRREHALAVEVEVAAGLPQGGAADMGRIHHVVAPAEVDVFPVVLDQRAYAAPFGCQTTSPGPISSWML